MGGRISKDSIRRQENYVEGNFTSARKDSNSRGYSDNQIRGKLRNDYYGARNNNDYVLASDWSKIRGGRQ
jgi:hypothetical protein